MSKEPTLQQPNIEFVQTFLQPEQLQRMLIFFSKRRPTDPHAQYGFSDVIVRLINEPLCIIFGQHGVYLFSNYVLLYPYNELDEAQTAYITQFLRMHASNIPNPGTPLQEDASTRHVVPSMQIDARVTKQMGGGYTVRPVQLTNIRLDAFDVLTALVRGIMCGSQKHDVKYRQHAVNLQLQRIMTRIVVSRAQLQGINTEIEACMEKQKHQTPVCGPIVTAGMTRDSVSDAMVECV